MKQGKLFIALTTVALFSACGDPTIQKGLKEHYCAQPRPKICPFNYHPVCAKPLNKTYSNGCLACSDKRVSSFSLGACKEKESDD